MARPRVDDSRTSSPAAHGFVASELEFEQAITRGLRFLAQSQSASGQFPAYTAIEFDGGEEEEAFDSTCFATVLVADCLETHDDPHARTMVDRALEFLLAEMEPFGMWRFWPREHPRHLEIPVDADDTACISRLLRSHGLSVPDNRSLLLANRDRRGLFYTWFIPRWSPPPRNLDFWRVASQRWRTPVQDRRFFRLTPATRTDVDSVVNANVLRYLGECVETRPVIKLISTVLSERREEGHDPWYHSRFAFYYMVSRCVASGVGALDHLGEDVLHRIVAAANEDGSIGSNPVETAQAVCAAHNWNRSAPALDDACRFLLLAQDPDGGWPTAAVYGVRGTLEWGSRALTTAFCLEALRRHYAPGR